MHQLNRNLGRDDLAGRFVTLFYIAIDSAARKMHWASAGHDPAILYRASADTFSELGGDDIPLGVDPNWSYRDDTFHNRQPGDLGLLGTDGIWEARNANGEMVGQGQVA